MSPEISALLEELEASPARTLAWADTRKRIHELHEKAGTFEERGVLLKIYVVLMDAVERMKLVNDVDEFREIRRKDYNLLLVRESSDGQNIVPSKLLAVVEREIAAGHMPEDDEMRKLAQYGTNVLGDSQPENPSKKSWWTRITGR